MPEATQIGIPTLVRIKPGALPRSGLYLARAARRHVLLLSSAGTPPAIEAAMREGVVLSFEHEGGKAGRKPE